jgi:hypothetical protein
MRARLRFCALLLVFLIAASPIMSAPSLVATVVADDHKDENDKGNDDKGKDKDDEDKGKEKNKDKNEDKKPKKQVETIAGYTIEIDCGEADDEDPGNAEDRTTACTFTAVEPDGGKKVTHVLIPAEVACADASGDVAWVDPDPNINRAGYRHEGQKPFSVVFEGVVTTAGSATYWVKAANRVLPATGPGLTCADPDQEQAEDVSIPQPTAGPTESGGTIEPSPVPTTAPTAAPTQTPVPTTGIVTVVTYTCPGVTLGADIDWFGTCGAAAGGTSYTLDDGKTALNGVTGEDGSATFGDLVPGTYALNDDSGNWCHAESDNVNTEGDVVVEAGVTTTVWLFYCE